MPDSSAGTKELYLAWIAEVGRVLGLGFHSGVPRGTIGAISNVNWSLKFELQGGVFHVERFRATQEHMNFNDSVPRGTVQRITTSSWGRGEICRRIP